MVRNKSFTVIELLVVIALIGLISSIALVTLDLPGKKQKAKIAKTLEFSQSIQSALGSEAVGIWEFDEGSGNTATDRSGLGNNGAIGGAVYSPNTPQSVLGQGQGKYALSFNGSNNYVELGNPATFNQNFTEFTVEAWFNSNVWSTEYPAPDYSLDELVSKWDRQVGNIDVGFRLERFYGGANFGFLVSSGIDMGSNAAYVPISKVSTGVWHHAVGTFKGGSFIRLYLDGALVSEQTSGIYSQVTAAKNVNLRIGIMSHGYGFFNGLIDEVRIYGQALTIGEIQQHYAEGLEKHLSLNGY